jgi:signal transduction histidine kinase
VFAYIEVRRTRLAAAEERVANVSVLLAEAMRENLQRLETQIDGLAKLPTLVAYLESRAPEVAAQLQSELTTLVARAPGLESIEIWNRDGDRLLSTLPAVSPATDDSVAGLLRRVAASGRPVVGDFYEAEGRVLYAAAGVVAGAREPLGYVVQRRALATSPEANRRLRDLVGPDAVFYLGNASGDLWTDLQRRVTGRAIPLPPVVGVARLAHVPAAQIAATTRVPASGWAVFVELPPAAILGPLRPHALRLAAITLVGSLVGILLVWIVGVRLTRPLADLAAAASRVANEDFGGRVVPGARNDEIAVLARAFNRMSESVERGHNLLEQRVAERTAELDAANEELKAFSYSVSHDLRGPLRAIDGFSLALLEDAAPRLDETEKVHLTRIRAASQRMAELIDDLLKLARVTHAELEREDVNVSALVAGVADRLRERHGEHEVEVVVEDGLRARADPDLLRVAFENLLDNAWKFTGGRSGARVAVRASAVDGHVELEVADNGVGFDPAYADKLFRPFQRLHGQREFAGNGIGLATVHRIVKRHGGEVRAEGALGMGATIRFSLGPEAITLPERCA